MHEPFRCSFFEQLFLYMTLMLSWRASLCAFASEHWKCLTLYVGSIISFWRALITPIFSSWLIVLSIIVAIFGVLMLCPRVKMSICFICWDRKSTIIKWYKFHCTVITRLKLLLLCAWFFQLAVMAGKENTALYERYFWKIVCSLCRIFSGTDRDP